MRALHPIQQMDLRYLLEIHFSYFGMVVPTDFSGVPMEVYAVAVVVAAVMPCPRMGH